MVRGVIFDMGGTILDYGGAGGWRRAWQMASDNVYAILAPAGVQVEPAVLSATMMSVEMRLWNGALAGDGAPTIAQELHETFLELEIPLDPVLLAASAEAYGRGLQQACEVYSDSESTLQDLRSKGMKIGLISNTVVPGTVHIHDLRRFGLLPYLDDLIFSSDARMWKPDPAIFRRSMANLRLGPDDCVFVGDRMIDDVWGAQRAKMRGILKYRDSADQDYVEGKRRGIEPDATIHNLAELTPLLVSLNGRLPARRS